MSEVERGVERARVLWASPLQILPANAPDNPRRQRPSRTPHPHPHSTHPLHTALSARAMVSTCSSHTPRWSPPTARWRTLHTPGRCAPPPPPPLRRALPAPHPSARNLPAPHPPNTHTHTHTLLSSFPFFLAASRCTLSWMRSCSSSLTPTWRVSEGGCERARGVGAWARGAHHPAAAAA